jgi:phosphate starvation-inducible PhoH-like protein
MYGSQSVRKTQSKGKSKKTAVQNQDGFFSNNVIEFGHKQWQSPPNFKPLTANHLHLLKVIERSPITIVSGPAGSLKTFLALQYGLRSMKEGEYDRYIYARQNIKRPNEKELGSLPGVEALKLDPLIAPILDNLAALVPPGELSYLSEKGKIKGSDINMIRGRSPLNSFIHLDEAQNCDLPAIKAVMTRKATSSKLVITGDFVDQKDVEGDPAFDAFEYVCRKFASHPRIKVVTLTKDDILRDELITDILDIFDDIKREMKRR